MQILSTIQGNRNFGIMCEVQVVPKNNIIRLSMPGLFLPMILYGYEENLHTETEFDKASNYEIAIECKDEWETGTVQDLIYDQFVGLQEYIDTKILLNRDGKSIFLCFGAECDYYPIFAFIRESRLKK